MIISSTESHEEIRIAESIDISFQTVIFAGLKSSNIMKTARISDNRVQ